MTFSQQPATTEQARSLEALLERWDNALRDLEARAEHPAEPLLKQSRQLLERYRRTLARDCERGIEHVPASELFRAISTAQASIKRLTEDTAL